MSTFNKNAPVFVALTTSGGPSGKIAASVNVTLTLEQLGITEQSSGAAPDFAEVAAAIAQINKSTSISTDEKTKRAQKLTADFQRLVSDYQKAGNLPLPDRVATAVIDYLVAYKNFSRTDTAGKAVLAEKDVQVTMNTGSDGSVSFVVSGTSVWG
jgi:hypothetical protein